jgi:hypothetical protein
MDDAGSWADWAENQYEGYTNKELIEFYKMEAPTGDDPGDWHGGLDPGIDVDRKRFWVLPDRSHRQAATFVPRSKAARAGMKEDDRTWTHAELHYPRRS